MLTTDMVCSILNSKRYTENAQQKFTSFQIQTVKAVESWTVINNKPNVIILVVVKNNWEGPGYG